MPSNCVAHGRRPARSVAETVFRRPDTMKKILLALAAFATLTATALAALAPISARASTTTRRPSMRPVPTTGPASISAAISAAPSAAATTSTARCSAITAPALLGGVQAGADWQFAPNWVLGIEGQYSWLGKQQPQRGLPRRLRLQQRPARPRLDHRPRRLHLGSGPGLRQGRLRLFRQRARR